MVDSDEGKTRSNGFATGGGSEEGGRGTIEVELHPVVACRGGDTLSSVLRDFFAGAVSLPPPALLLRIKSSIAKSFPRLQDGSRNSASGPVASAPCAPSLSSRYSSSFACSRSSIDLIGFSWTNFGQAMLTAIIVSLLVSLAAAGGFMAFFFTCLIAIYFGALSIAAFLISITTISAIIAVMVATGWIRFFWIVWLVTKKSLHLTSQSISKTSSSVSTYATAWQTALDVAVSRSAG